MNVFDDLMIWRDFASEVHYREWEQSLQIARDLFIDEPFKRIGQFVFEEDQYDAELDKVLTHPLRDLARTD